MKLPGLLCAAVLAASAGAASAQAPQALEVSEVQVGVLQIGAHLPIFAAQELGYFAEEGLKVAMQFGTGGATLLPLIIQGQLQIGNVPVSSVLQARARNLDVVMIGPGNSVARMGPPDQAATIVKADSKATRPADLAGKRIAVNVINSLNWLYNRELLQRAGVDPRSVQYVELPFPNMVDAVVNGQVDAAAVVQPFIFFGSSSGKVRVLSYDLVEVQPGVLITGYTVSRKWAMAHPRTLRAFARALSRAVDTLNANDVQARQIFAKVTKMKMEIIEGAGLPRWSNELPPDNVRKQMDLMLKHGLLKSRLDASQMIWDLR